MAGGKAYLGPQPAPPPKFEGVNTAVRLDCLKIAADRLMKAGQIHDADAVIALAKRFEGYVLGPK